MADDDDPLDFSTYIFTEGGILRLEFTDLFLREPGEGEHDVVLGIREL